MNFDRSVWALGVGLVAMGLAGTARADIPPGTGGGGGAGGGGTTASTTGSTTGATTAGSGGGSSGGESTEDSCSIASIGARSAAGAVSGVALLGLVAASLTMRRRRDRSG